MYHPHTATGRNHFIYTELLEIKVLTNEKRGGLKVISFDRSPYSRKNFQKNLRRPHPVRGLELLREPCLCHLQSIIEYWKKSFLLHRAIGVNYLYHPHTATGRNHFIYTEILELIICIIHTQPLKQNISYIQSYWS